MKREVGNEKTVRVNTDHSFKKRSAMKAYRARAKGMLGGRERKDDGVNRENFFLMAREI